MKISDMTTEEVFRVKARANFTDREARLFDLRNRDVPLEECAERMDCSISTINRLHKRVKTKVVKVF